MSFLPHSALRRVLQSLVTATYAKQQRGAAGLHPSADPWSDGFSMRESGAENLGCDSLDLLRLSSAVNEMFHLHEAGLETELLRTATFGQWLALIEEAWKRGVQHLTVSTSGSTGWPKACTHSFATLDLEVEFLAGLFQGRTRIVAYTPAHHIYGLLFTALLPAKLCIPMISLVVAASAGARATLQAGDLVVSFPEGWAWIERNIKDSLAGVEGVVSTAPCPAALTETMARRLDRWTEVYGSSETAGIGTRTWPAPGYSLMPHWSGIGEGCWAGALRHNSGHTVELMDDLKLLADGTFLVEKRKDSGVQIGGVNVFPALIAKKLEAYPGVAAATVRPMRPQEGDRLKCFVVPRAGYTSDDLEVLLGRWIASWPIAAEMPKSIRMGTEIPVGAAGKGCDWF